MNPTERRLAALAEVNKIRQSRGMTPIEDFSPVDPQDPVGGCAVAKALDAKVGLTTASWAKGGGMMGLPQTVTDFIWDVMDGRHPDLYQTRTLTDIH